MVLGQVCRGVVQISGVMIPFFPGNGIITKKTGIITPLVQIGSGWRKKRRRRTCAFDTLLAPVMFRDKSRPITMKSLHVFLDVSQDTQIRERVPK